MDHSFIAGERVAYLTLAQAALAKECERWGPVHGQRACSNARSLAADIAELAPLAAGSQWQFDDSLMPRSILPPGLLPPFRFAAQVWALALG